ncbi:MAG: NCS1 family nucleobase:cation symporter-1 [Motiliproteus sp.]
MTTGSLSWFYQYGWFTGSLLGGLIYWVAASKQSQTIGSVAVQGN